MSAEMLRRAAALMRARANGCALPPWTKRPVDVDVSDVRIMGLGWNLDPVTVAITYGPPTEHIASWHPAVALAVADLLDQTARDWQLIDDGVIWSSAITWEATKVRALTIARTYLGESA